MDLLLDLPPINKVGEEVDLQMAGPGHGRTGTPGGVLVY